MKIKKILIIKISPPLKGQIITMDLTYRIPFLFLKKLIDLYNKIINKKSHNKKANNNLDLPVKKS